MTERYYPGKRASAGWAALATYVVAYDVWAIKNGHETLSGAFWRALDDPKKRWIVVGAWVIVTKHLVFPEILAKADPLNVIAWGMRKINLG